MLFVEWTVRQREGYLWIGGAGQAALFEHEGGVRKRIDYLAGSARTGAWLVEGDISHDPARAITVAH